MKLHSLIAHEKNDVIASENNDENDIYSMFKLKILSDINVFRTKKETCRHREYIRSVNENERI